MPHDHKTYWQENKERLREYQRQWRLRTGRTKKTRKQMGSEEWQSLTKAETEWRKQNTL